MPRFSFQGDGAYAGDGGAALQHVWLQHDWKPLKNCDGRFVQRGKELSSTTLSTLCTQWKVSSATPVLRFDIAGQDSMECLRCVGGGGLLTYCKSDDTFVHTLNTESGLCRKLLALGIGVNAMQRALDQHCLFGILCTVLSHIPEPERTLAAPAVAVALRFGLARSALRQECLVTADDAAEERPATPLLSCTPCDRPSVEAYKKKRSVDFLLEGRSVKSNRFLARFAAAPYLPRLLTEPAFSMMLNRTSRAMRKELIEAYVMVEALESLLPLGSSHGDGAALPVAEGDTAACAVVDLCSGKGFLSLILALEYPSLPVIMVDSNQSESYPPSHASPHACAQAWRRGPPVCAKCIGLTPTELLLTCVRAAGIKAEHVEAISNLSFLRADITAADFPATLAAALDAAAATTVSAASTAGQVTAQFPPRCVAVGMHLCGLLSPCAIALFAATPLLQSLILVPCCLDKRVDGALKFEARQQGIDPYEAKVRQLSAMLRDRASAEVVVLREGSMRTVGGESTEGSDAAKNALIIGTKALKRPVGEKVP